LLLFVFEIVFLPSVRAAAEAFVLEVIFLIPVRAVAEVCMGFGDTTWECAILVGIVLWADTWTVWGTAFLIPGAAK